jgi:MipA family protein
VIGARLTHAPQYQGSDEQQTRLNPVWAFQFGRYRLSGAGGGGLLAFRADDVAGPGASADLLERRGLKLGAGLRLDRGRDASDPTSGNGLAEVRGTVRGRVYGSYALTDAWSVSTSLSQDLLGRGGGALVLVDTSYRLRLSEHADLSFGAGLSYGDARYMRSRFGVSLRVAQQTGLPRYTPGAALHEWRAGVDVVRALSARWVAFAGLDVYELVSAAADSPLTRRDLGSALSVGLVYRCCR